MDSNERIVSTLWSSEHDEEMMAKTEEEAAKGWLGTPVPLTREHMERYNLSRRMAVEEFREHEVSAENPLGKRLRLVDDLSESIVNFATGCTRAVRNDLAVIL